MTQPKILSILLAIFLCMGVTDIAVAQNFPVQSNTTRQSNPNSQRLQSPQIQRSQTTQDTLKNRANREVDRRIQGLTNAMERVTTFSQLSDEAKRQMATRIQNEIRNLTQTKSRLQNQTTQDVTDETGHIRDSYPTFAVYMPKVVTLSAAERMLTIADKMTIVQQKLLTQVTMLGETNADISTLEQSLIDAEESITQASENAQDIIDTVLPLSPEEYPQNRTVFQTARQTLRAGRLSLISARDNIRSVFTELQTQKEIPSNETTVEDAMIQPNQTTPDDSSLDARGGANSEYVEIEEPPQTLQSQQEVQSISDSDTELTHPEHVDLPDNLTQ